MSITGISERLTGVRLRTGMTQEAFGELIGVSKSAVWRMERGDHLPGAEILARLCDVLNISADWLLLGRGGDRGTEAPAQESKVIRKGGSLLRSQWDVLALLHERPATESELSADLGLNAFTIHDACMTLHRQGLILPVEHGWQVVSRDVSLRALTDADIDEVVQDAMQALNERIVPGTRGTDGAIVKVTLKVAAPLPGQKVMAALRDTLERIEDDAGTRMTLVIGVAVDR